MKQVTILSILFTILGTANAAVIVDTTTSSFYSFDSATSTENESSPSSDADGLTMNITFTPNADDIDASDTDGRALLEIGGASNGSGLWLYQGEVYFRVKMNGGNNDDTSTYPDLDQTDSDNMVAVRSSNITGAANGGAFAAGTEYSVAAILDPTNPTGAITLAYQPTGGSLFTETWSISADGTNWIGNNTSNAYLGGGSSQVGGASKDSNTNFPDTIATAFSGTKGDAFMWNEVGTAVPEPSSFALLAGMFGLTWIMLRRRS